MTRPILKNWPIGRGGRFGRIVRRNMGLTRVVPPAPMRTTIKDPVEIIWKHKQQERMAPTGADRRWWRRVMAFVKGV